MATEAGARSSLEYRVHASDGRLVWLRDEAGIDYPRIKGGYKAMRTFLIDTLQQALAAEPDVTRARASLSARRLTLAWRGAPERANHFAALLARLEADDDELERLIGLLPPGPRDPRSAKSPAPAAMRSSTTRAANRSRPAASMVVPMAAMRTATPFATCSRTVEAGESAATDEISSPRFIGPGCITIASGAASASFSASSPQRW